MCALLLSQSATWPNGAGRFFLNKINVFSFFKSDSTDMRLPRWNQIDTRLSDFTRRFPDPFVYDAVPLICGCTASEIASTRWVPFGGFQGSFQRLFQLPRRAHLSGYVTFQSSYNGCGFFPHFKCTRRSQGRYRTVAPPPACGRRASAMSVDVLDMNHRTVYDVEDDVARARGAAASEGSRVPPADRGDARTWCRLTRARHAARDGQIPCAGLPLTPSCAVQDSQ